MAISKRLRYEVLRRDNHTCRYCGATAPDATITIDHVTPVALGGTDDPANLVAACKDCNAGKSASNPDQPLVEDVSAENLRWGRAMARAAEAQLADRERREALQRAFHEAWCAWTYGPDNARKTFPLPGDWRASVDNILAAGLPIEILLECVDITLGNRYVKDEFRYLCGVAWNPVHDMQEIALSLIAADEDQEGKLMARIRSIKPEFFTDEKIAGLSLSARLTFIGLWTYVDDNGVGLDNERLIVSAIWPLEYDVIATLQRTREDLRSLADAEMITRYEHRAHKLIHIRTFGDHQRVSHPRKARYPHPCDVVTSVNGVTEHPREDFRSPPEDFASGLRPEQGAGSREQGAGNTTAEVVTTSVEGTAPGRIELPTKKWMDDEKSELPPDRPGLEAERRRQIDALAEWERQHPELSPQ